MKLETIYLQKQNKSYHFNLVKDNATKTKIKREVLTKLAKSPFDNLNSCYSSCSYQKENAYDKELSKALDLGADVWGIISYNSNIFTFGYTFDFENKKYVALITPSYDYLVELQNYDE